MNKNTIVMEIGGAQRTLRFNIRTMNCLQEITGIDPLQFKAESDTWSEILPYATKIIHAALLAECMCNKQEPDFTADDVQNWINDLNGADLLDVITRYNAMFTKQ